MLEVSTRNASRTRLAGPGDDECKDRSLYERMWDCRRNGGGEDIQDLKEGREDERTRG